MSQELQAGIDAAYAEEMIAHWIKQVNLFRSLVCGTKSNYPQFKRGYQCSAAGILNAYREGDLRFDEAVAALEALNR